MTEIVNVPDLVLPSPFPTMGDREAGTYNRKSCEWADSEPAFGQSVVAIAEATRINALATQAIAEDAKTVTGQNKTAAQQAQEAAELAADKAAGSAAFYGRWSELTGALDMPANVTHSGKDWRLVRLLPDVTAAEPGVSDAWEIVEGNALKRQQRSSNVQLSKEDSGQLIDIVSGTFTQTFSDASELGSGWWCYLQNSGDGDITIPASDGRTNWIMYPEEVRLFQCDGEALRSIVINPFYKAFTASGTFIKPPGYSVFCGELFSGGSSGIRNDSNWANGGAGGGGFPFSLRSSTLSNAVYVTIGAGGVWSNSNPYVNAPGGSSSFGSVTVANEGPIGFGYTSAATQRRLYSGGAAVMGAISNVNQSYASSIWGGGAGATFTQGNLSNNGGVSMFAGNGGRQGADGQIPAGGGGSCPGWQTPGNGARGELRIWGVK